MSFWVGLRLTTAPMVILSFAIDPMGYSELLSRTSSNDRPIRRMGTYQKTARNILYKKKKNKKKTMSFWVGLRLTTAPMVILSFAIDP